MVCFNNKRLVHKVAFPFFDSKLDDQHFFFINGEKLDLGERVLLMYAMGWPSCIKTTLVPFPQASVSMRKVLEKYPLRIKSSIASFKVQTLISKLLNDIIISRKVIEILFGVISLNRLG